MKIGVVGNGYVGSAVRAFWESRAEVLAWDTDPARCTHSQEEVANADLVFLCVPTPHVPGAGADHTAVFGAAEWLDRLRGHDNGWLLVKSTVAPGTCRDLQDVCSRFLVVSSPEFLTQRTAREDYADPSSVVLGFGPDGPNAELVHVHRQAFPGAIIQTVPWEAAELIKLARNSFYAVKVGFFNDLADVCAAYHVPFDDVRDGVLASGWVNPMHTLVPGPDGQRGFGGACLPKDSLALVHAAGRYGAPMAALRAAIEANRGRRPEVP